MVTGRKKGENRIESRKQKRWKTDEKADAIVNITPKKSKSPKKTITVSVQQQISLLLMLEPQNPKFQYFLACNRRGPLDIMHKKWISYYYNKLVCASIAREKSRK